MIRQPFPSCDELSQFLNHEVPDHGSDESESPSMFVVLNADAAKSVIYCESQAPECRKIDGLCGIMA